METTLVNPVARQQIGRATSARQACGGLKRSTSTPPEYWAA
jgi:hypothetical protein